MSRPKPAETWVLHWDLLLGIGLAALTVAAYGGACNNEFVNYDDPLYVYKNPRVQNGLTARGLAWAWTTFHAGNWHPLTWMSLQLDYELYGLSAAGYHLTNLLLHTANVVLLFLVLHRLTGDRWPSAVAAALFVVHPLHVESVAWVTERKDVLSTLCWILGLGAYAAYVVRPTLRRYLLVAAVLILGLLAKPMVVTLPVVLLLLDYWPLGRLKSAVPARRLNLLLEKLPLLAVAAAFGALTIYAQHQSGAMPSLEAISPRARLANVLVSYVRYLGKTFWPADLAVFYPHPLEGLPTGQVIGAGVLLALITAAALALARRFPYFLVGWSWFVITLLPVSGLLQAGEQAMADRFTYVPNLGLYIALAWGLRDLLAWRPAIRAAVVPAAIAALVVCLVLTRKQVGYWRDSVTLWQHTIAATGPNAYAHWSLGNAFRESGDHQAAMREYLKALEIEPGMPRAHHNLADVLFQARQFAEAAAHYEAALAANPNLAITHNGLGMVLLLQSEIDQLQGKADEAARKRAAAIERFERALEINPNLADAHANLGIALLGQGKIAAAEEHARQAVEINPGSAKGHNTLALCYLHGGRLEEAAFHLQEILRINPRNAEAHHQLGLVLGRQRKWPEAVAHHQEAVRLAPHSVRYQGDLAAALGAAGRFEEAAETTRKALKLAAAANQAELTQQLQAQLRLYEMKQVPETKH